MRRWESSADDKREKVEKREFIPVPLIQNAKRTIFFYFFQHSRNANYKKMNERKIAIIIFDSEAADSKIAFFPRWHSNEVSEQIFRRQCKLNAEKMWIYRVDNVI